MWVPLSVQEESFKEWSALFSACRPHASPTCRTDNLRTVFSKCGLWPPAPGLPEVLIKHADCQHPRVSEISIFSCLPGVCYLQSLRNQALKTWSCQSPLTQGTFPSLGQGYTGPLGAGISYSALGTVAPTALMGNKLAVVSIGADRLACAQPSQGRP